MPGAQSRPDSAESEWIVVLKVIQRQCSFEPF